MKTNSIRSKLLMAEVAITNAFENGMIRAALVDYNYDEARLNEGIALYDKAQELFTKQIKEYSDQFQATDDLDRNLSKANAEYMKHVKIARIALKNDVGAQQALQISGRRNKTYSGWLKQAKSFYANALASEEILSALSKFGITPYKLKEGEQSINVVETILHRQWKAKGEAQNATQARDEAFEALQDWMADFVGISHIALDGNLHYLEMLGIVKPS